MSAIAFAIPGDLSLPTGGYGYDRRLLDEWRASGVPARHIALPAGFPHPSGQDIAATESLLDALPPDAVLLVDGLAYGAFPEPLTARLRQKIVALVHHPLCLETGLSAADAAALRASETAALRHAAAVVVTSPMTARTLAADFGVPAERIAVAEPGVDPAPRATGSRPGAPLNLLAVGNVVPRKGYAVLVEALATLPSLPWRLTIVGSLTLAPDTAVALRRQIEAEGLSDRIAFAGAVDAAGLAQAYATADLFVMPSLYEGYGMVLTEALARGLPILCTTGGAAAETVPDAAAVKVRPGDATALAAALGALIAAAPRRAAMAEAAWRAAPALPRWGDTAARVARACLEGR